jgi:hypothetical protein
MSATSPLLDCNDATPAEVPTSTPTSGRTALGDENETARRVLRANCRGDHTTAQEDLLVVVMRVPHLSDAVAAERDGRFCCWGALRPRPGSTLRDISAGYGEQIR